MFWKKSIDIKYQNTGRVLILFITFRTHLSLETDNAYFSHFRINSLYYYFNIRTKFHYCRVRYRSYTFHIMYYCRQSEYLCNSKYPVYKYMYVHPLKETVSQLSIRIFLTWTQIMAYKVEPFDICELTNVQCKLFCVCTICRYLFLTYA